VTDGPVWWQLAVAAAGGFLAGSINPATLLTRARGVNIRQLGSGNPGATNTARALGKRAGVLVAVLDILKGFIPVVVFSGWSPQAGAIAGLAAVLGHVFSPFLNWKGGKGVATTLGVVLGMQPWWAVPMLIAFAVTVAVTKRVGIGAVAGAMVLVVIGIWFTDSRVETAFALALGLIVIIRHYRNIMELFTGVSHIGDGAP
jgi:acyl phosphate:glycerol-3-phosphate acyltransferase